MRSAAMSIMFSRSAVALKRVGLDQRFLSGVGVRSAANEDHVFQISSFRSAISSAQRILTTPGKSEKSRNPIVITTAHNATPDTRP